MGNGMEDLEMGDLTVQIRIEFSTYGTLQGKATKPSHFQDPTAPLAGQDKQPDHKVGGSRGKQAPASPRKREGSQAAASLIDLRFQGQVLSAL